MSSGVNVLELPTVEQRKTMLHYVVCLLPKPNRDILEVLLAFLRVVASYSSGENGNRMDVKNLATVFAPNILYNKAKETAKSMVKDESFLAIDAICMLIQHQDELWVVSALLFLFSQNENDYHLILLVNDK
jgi:hypothetical protein